MNTLALRNRFDASAGFIELLGVVKATTLGAYQHQQYPFDELVDKLPLPRDLSRHPLFDVMVVLQSMREAGDRFVGEGLRGLNVSVYEGMLSRNNKFDLLFDCMKTGESIRISLHYNGDLFLQETMMRISSHLKCLAIDVIKTPNIPIGKIDLLDDQEKHTLLHVFNNTEIAFPSDKSIDVLFEEQVQRNPQDIAINFYGTCHTYAQLDMLSNQLAYFLKDHVTIIPNAIIGIKLERSERFIATVLGVLKSGAAYMPIDPYYPSERIEFMEADSQCLLTIDESLYKVFLNKKDVYPVTPVVRTTHPDNLVYLIYTSGSTGVPKGIMMKHTAMVNLMHFHIRQFREGDARSVLQCASTSFDVSFQEMFSTLLRGATLFPIKEEEKKDQAELVDFVAKNRIDTVFLPTAYFKILMDNSYFIRKIDGCVKSIIVAGEQLTVSESFLDYLRKGEIQLYNHYGPAETHVVTVCQIGRNQEVELRRIPSIGKPIDNNRVYILNDQNALVPLVWLGRFALVGAVWLPVI